LRIPISIDQLAGEEGDFGSTGHSSATLLLPIAGLPKELLRAEAPQLQELVFSFFMASETGNIGRIHPLKMLHRIRFTELDKMLSQSQHPFPSLHAVSFSCEEHVPTPPSLESRQSPRIDNLAHHIPLRNPSCDALDFEEMGSTFLEMGFPLTLARGSVALQLLNASQDMALNTLLWVDRHF
jgi:hypothetical protein